MLIDIKVRKRPILALKCTFWGQNKFNFRVYSQYLDYMGCITLSGFWINISNLPGFVVAASNDVDIYYYMDEAGNVLSDMPEWAPVPEWGVDIKCGKGTNFRYVNNLFIRSSNT